MIAGSGRPQRWLSRGFAVFCTMAALFPGGCAALCKPPEPSRAAEPDLLAVPDVRQSTDYAGGATALQSVLAYYGRSWGEDELMEEFGTNEDVGTTYESIVPVAKEQGLKATTEEHVTLDRLRAAIADGIPVIVATQAWVETRPPGFSWAESWDEGHFVVVIGMDPETIDVEDPSLFGTRGRRSLGDFTARWHDEDFAGASSADARTPRWNQPGIFVLEQAAGKRNVPAFAPVG